MNRLLVFALLAVTGAASFALGILADATLFTPDKVVVSAEPAAGRHVALVVTLGRHSRTIVLSSTKAMDFAACLRALSQGAVDCDHGIYTESAPSIRRVADTNGDQGSVLVHPNDDGTIAVIIERGKDHAWANIAPTDARKLGICLIAIAYGDSDCMGAEWSPAPRKSSATPSTRRLGRAVCPIGPGGAVQWDRCIDPCPQAASGVQWSHCVPKPTWAVTYRTITGNVITDDRRWGVTFPSPLVEEE